MPNEINETLLTPARKEWFRNRIYGWMCDDDDKEELLDITISFIRKNLSPDEVFSTKELQIFYEDHRDKLENKLPVNY